MSNIALQIQRLAAGTIPVAGNVIFDSTVYSTSNINYNSMNGVITFNESGRFAINWWFASQSSQSTNGIVLSLSSSQGDFIEGTSPQKTSEIYGTGIIHVVTAPMTVSLVNASLTDIHYSPIVPVKSTLEVIHEDTAKKSGI